MHFLVYLPAAPHGQTFLLFLVLDFLLVLLLALSLFPALSQVERQETMWTYIHPVFVKRLLSVCVCVSECLWVGVHIH